VLVAAPHMDDEVLGCGGALARLPDRTLVHVLYAGDGCASPRVPRPAPPEDPGLGAVRAAESRAAMAVLGVPDGNLTFLGLPDWTLSRHHADMVRAVEQRLAATGASTLLAPFRLDRHPDHEALSRACRDCAPVRDGRAALLEYFVYYRWRLLPGGDMRRHLRPEWLVRVDLDAVANTKRRALACFRTQVTVAHPWQDRPVLSAEIVDESCRAPELFLKAPRDIRDRGLFTLPYPLIRLVHGLEPWIKFRRYEMELLRQRLARGREAAP
jgi:LmbE family N-acetylglucosaminyl deacetylase